MFNRVLFLSLTLAFPGQAAAQAGPWAQCGGIGFTGPTTCVEGWVCTYSNPYHSQCLQYSSTTVTTTFTPTPTTTYTPLPTLSPEPGWGYVDGDETIIYYLQSEVLNTASGAVFSTASNASQIQIADGQLVQNALGTLLYATPEARANSTVTKLAVSWSTEPATGVTFFLTSDYVTMGIQISGIENPGFLLCPAAEGDYYYFFLNLENDVTPAGCINEAVFIYFGSIVV